MAWENEMFTEPTEIGQDLAQELSFREDVGQMWAYGGCGFGKDYLLIYANNRVLFCPKEFLSLKHRTIGSEFHSGHDLVKKFLDMQSEEISQFLEG